MKDSFLSVRHKHTLDYYFIKKITLMNSQKTLSLTLVKLGGIF